MIAIEISQLEWVNESKPYHLTANCIYDEAKKRLPNHLFLGWFEMGRLGKRLGDLITCSVKTLCAVFKRSERTVQYDIKELVDMGWMKVQYNYDEYGCQLPNTYIVCVPSDVIMEFRKYPDRAMGSVDITYSVDEPFFEGEGAMGCTPLIITNPDITKSNKAAPIPACSSTNQEQETARPVPFWAKKEAERFVRANKAISDPGKLIAEIINHIGNSVGLNVNHALNAAKKFIREGRWTTPYRMKYGKQEYIDEHYVQSPKRSPVHSENKYG